MPRLAEGEKIKLTIALSLETAEKLNLLVEAMQIPRNTVITLAINREFSAVADEEIRKQKKRRQALEAAANEATMLKEQQKREQLETGFKAIDAELEILGLDEKGQRKIPKGGKK